MVIELVAGLWNKEKKSSIPREEVLMARDYAKEKREIDAKIIKLSWSIEGNWRKDPRIVKLQAKKRKLNSLKNLQAWGKK